MRLGEIQDYVYERLTTDDLLEGATIVKEDGDFPKTPGLEAGLKESGLAIIVFPIESNGFTSITPSGHSILSVEVDVVVAENRKINASESGIGISAEEACHLVLERILGSGENQNAQQRFAMISNGFVQLGQVNGLNMMVATMAIAVPVNPRA